MIVGVKKNNKKSHKLNMSHANRENNSTAATQNSSFTNI